MKSLIKILGIALFGAATFTSCLSDDVTSESCSYSIQNPIVEVTGPSTGTVGQQVTLSVKFNRTNACYVSSEFVETGTNPKTITALSAYVGCVCAQSTDVLTKEYKFTPTAAGEYQFKFQGNNNTFITKTVTIAQ
jgi:hypothetical protein